MAGFGETDPLPSPDGQWVVFGRDSNLHLLDVASGQDRQITGYGKPYKWPYASVEVLTSAWSNDSRRILLSVVHGDTDCPDECGPHDFWIRKAPYGFYVYDLTTKVIQRIFLPQGFRFQAWLSDGALLGMIESPETKLCEETLLVFQSGKAQGISSGAPPGPLQVKLSADSKWAVGVFRAGCAHPDAAQIIKIDLTAKTAAPVTPVFPWGENQWPRFSPAVGQIAYVHRDRTVDHIPQESLIVDGASVYSCEGTVQYEWVDEQRVALACRDEVIVQDIETGAALSRYSLAPSSP